MDRKILILLIGLFTVLCSMTGVGQDGLLLGVVRDSSSRQPISGVHITVVGRDDGAVSDADGRFAVAMGTGGQLTLAFSHVSYTPALRTVRPGDLRGGDLEVVLQRSQVQIPEVVVRRPAPEVVYARKDLHVGAYFANADGLWVLAYDRPRMWHPEEQAGWSVFQGARLYLLDTLFHETRSVILSVPVRDLRGDHQGRPVVEGLSAAWVAKVEGRSIALLPIAPWPQEGPLKWTDTIPGAVVGHDLTERYPAFNHVAYRSANAEVDVICAVTDELLLELFRSQYKYMSGRDKVIAMDLERALGVDREIIAGHMTGFSKDLYYRVPYAPLFVVRDTLCVFDHYRARVRWFSHGAEPLGEAPIGHQELRTWRDRLVQDAVTARVYAVFAKGPSTWLREVHIGTGALGPETVLEHAFPEAVQVHGGHAYYVHRASDTTERRTLYRSRLR